MKDYDGAVACISFDICKYLVGCDFPGIVPGHHVIHDEVVMVVYCFGLLPAQESVRRSEQHTSDMIVGFKYVVQVCARECRATLEVVHCMVAERMSLLTYLCNEFGMSLCVVAYHKECGFDIVSGQYVEYPGRSFGYGAVVKGQVGNFAAAFFDAPNAFGKQQAVEEGRLLYEHVFSVDRKHGRFVITGRADMMFRVGLSELLVPAEVDAFLLDYNILDFFGRDTGLVGRFDEVKEVVGVNIAVGTRQCAVLVGA